VCAENPPATKFIYALCHCGQLIGRRAVGLQGGSGSRGAPPHGRFYPLLWLRWFLHSIRWTGGNGPANSQTRASPAPTLTQTVTATLPPHATDKLQSFPRSHWGQASLLHLPWATGSLETGGPHTALLSAISDPCLVPRKILDPCRQMSLTSLWRVLGANHFGAALVQTSPNFVFCRS
jgi:hypothetical protein